MEMQRLVTSALLSNYRISRTAVNKHVLQSSREVPDVRFKTKFLDIFSYKSPLSYFAKIRPVGAALINAGRRTGGHNAARRPFPRLCERTSHPTRVAANDDATDLEGVSLTPGGQNIN